MTAPPPTDFAVVIPAHQAEATLGPCLEGVLSAGFDASEIIVVDDGSRDATAPVAQTFGVRLLTNPTPLRPAKARNRGVAETRADIIFFVDADVVIHGDVRAQLAARFADPEVTAVIGSYDDAARGGSVVSDYRNLLHHHTHQVSGGTSQTFWTGIGAVRREQFRALGGLASEWENIEDVEFGLRLTAAGGRIVLDPDIQGTHLKVWTPRSMFRTDLYGRAVPWTRLLAEGRAETGTLNTDIRHRVAAAGILATICGLVAALLWPPALLLTAGGVLAFLWASMPLLRRLGRARGPAFALRAVPWHALHYIAALAGFARVRLGLEGRREPG